MSPVNDHASQPGFDPALRQQTLAVLQSASTSTTTTLDVWNTHVTSLEIIPTWPPPKTTTTTTSSTSSEDVCSPVTETVVIQPTSSKDFYKPTNPSFASSNKAAGATSTATVAGSATPQPEDAATTSRPSSSMMICTCGLAIMTVLFNTLTPDSI